MRRKCTVFAVVFGVAVALIATGNTGEAEAAPHCDPDADIVDWTIPADGDVVSPDVRIKAVLSIGLEYITTGEDLTFFEVLDDDGDEIEGEEIEVDMEHGLGVHPAAYREFIPEQPLEPGDYEVSVNDGSTPMVEYSFTVDADLSDPEAPETVDFDWFHATQDTFQEYGCGGGIYELHSLAVESSAGTAAYIELFLELEGGAEGVQILPPDAYDGELRDYVFEDVECITAMAVADDGTAGEQTEYCEPQKCVDYQTDGNDLATNLGETDWDDVSGCGDNGDDSGGDGDGDNGDGDGDDSGCTVAPGSSPPAWLMALIALVAVRKSTTVR